MPHQPVQLDHRNGWLDRQSVHFDQEDLVKRLDLIRDQIPRRCIDHLCLGLPQRRRNSTGCQHRFGAWIGPRIHHRLIDRFQLRRERIDTLIARLTHRGGQLPSPPIGGFHVVNELDHVVEDSQPHRLRMIAFDRQNRIGRRQRFVGQSRDIPPGHRGHRSRRGADLRPPQSVKIAVQRRGQIPRHRSDRHRGIIANPPHQYCVRIIIERRRIGGFV